MEPRRGVSSACPSTDTPSPESSEHPAGEGEEAGVFFFFKLKPSKKGEMLSCNFGRDFQLFLSLSEWQNSSSILGEQRRGAMAQKLESAGC